MLENPLVVAPPNLLLHSQRRSSTADDMKLDNGTNLLLAKPTPIKRTAAGDLPLKKRYHRTDAVVVDKRTLAVFNEDSTSPPTSTETPVDFSLPTRIRAKSICIDKDDSIDKAAIRRNGGYHNRNNEEEDDSKSMALFGHHTNAAIFNFNASLLQLSNLWRTNFLTSPLINSLHIPTLITQPAPLPIASVQKNYVENVQSPEKSDISLVQHCRREPPLKKSKTAKNNNNGNFVINGDADSAGPLVESTSLSLSSSSSSSSSYVINPATGNRVRRCYKNMTTERRMEANARERTRVHTIGAAFERLRKLIPSLGADQKLSKLSILRISCSYIMLLAAMNDLDYSADGQAYTVEECTEMLTETINSEVKFKR